MSVLLGKFHLKNKEFTTSKELKEFCKSMKMDNAIVIWYFIPRDYLIENEFKG